MSTRENIRLIARTPLPVLILIAVYTETNRKVLIKILFKKSLEHSTKNCW